MIDFPAIIFDKVITYIATKVKEDLFPKDDPLLEFIIKDISIHQTMIEDIYISSLKTFSDYIKLGNYDKAAESLMDLSNREATPIANFLLGFVLFKNHNFDLAIQKLSSALISNPLLAEYIGVPYTKLVEMPDIHNTWCITPLPIKDNLLKKFFRLMVEVNEGVNALKVSTFGGHIAFIAYYESECCYGLINIENGNVQWMHTEKEESIFSSNYHTDRRLVLYTPKYLVYKIDDLYEVLELSKGIPLAKFSSKTFNLLFCPQILLKSNVLKPYELSYNLYDAYNDKFLYDNYDELKTLISSKKVKIDSFVVKKHKLWQTDGKPVHPGLSFDPLVYEVINYRFKLESINH